MSGFSGSAAIAKQAYTFMLLGAPLLPYRSKLTAGGGSTISVGNATGQPQGLFGPLVWEANSPVGTHSAAYDPLENSPTDSTVDGGTGYVGGWAAAIQAHVLILRAGEQAKYQRGRYGVELEEGEIAALLLASEVSPAYQDLIVDADGTRYCVGQDVAVFAVLGTVYGYRVSLERRDANDVTVRL